MVNILYLSNKIKNKYDHLVKLYNIIITLIKEKGKTMYIQKFTRNKSVSYGTAEVIANYISARDSASGFISNVLEVVNDKYVLTLSWNSQEDWYNFIKNNKDLFIDFLCETDKINTAESISTETYNSIT